MLPAWIRTPATHHSLTPANSQTLRGRGRQKREQHTVSLQESPGHRPKKGSDPKFGSRGAVTRLHPGEGGLVGAPGETKGIGHFKGQAPCSDPGAPSEFTPRPLARGHWLLYRISSVTHQHASRVGVVTASWRAGGARTPQRLPLSGRFAKSRTWPQGPTHTQCMPVKVPALTPPWLKVKRKEQRPGARGPWLSPFFSSGVNFPTCKVRQLGGHDSAPAQGWG